MKAVKISELKTHLSAYLRRVRKGEHILVMDRDEPIAEISPAPARAGERAFERLVREGKIIPARGNIQDLKITALGRKIEYQDLLDEVREDKV